MTRKWPHHLCSQSEDPSKVTRHSWPHGDQPGYCWGQVPRPKLGRSRDRVPGPCPAVSASSTVLIDADRHAPGFAGSLAPSPDTALLTCPVSASLACLIINDLHRTPVTPSQTWAYPRVQGRKWTSKGSDLSTVRLQGPGSPTACGPRVSHNTGQRALQNQLMLTQSMRLPLCPGPCLRGLELGLPLCRGRAVPWWPGRQQPWSY